MTVELATQMLLAALGSYYLANVSVDIARTYKKQVIIAMHVSEDRYPFNRKPFNCSLCMVGWLTAVLFFIPMPWIALPATAGVALLIEKISSRLDTFIS
jgi:hypothetical protein